MSDDYIEALKRQIRDRPVQQFQIEHTRRHRRLVLVHGGGKHFIVFPTSSKSRCGIRNFTAAVARSLDALGVAKPAQAPSPHRDRNCCTAQRAILPPAEKAAPRPDWHDDLARIAPSLFEGAA